MSNNRVEASNPNFTYALEQEDGENDGDNDRSPPAANGTDERAIVPRTPMYIEPQMPYASAEGSINLQPGNATTQAALVANVELTREANVGHIQVATAQGDGFKIAAAKGVNIKLEEKVCQRHEIVQTDEGLHFRTVTQVQRRIYAEIVNAICIEANLEEPEQLEIEEEADPAVDATCGEKCIDLCCQSCVCNFQNPFSRQREKPMVEKKDILTPILRRGRAKGWNIFTKFAFPLVRDTTRDFWVIAELLTILTACALSITSYVMGNRESFNIFHLALACLSTVLALIDAFFSLRECKSCKACKRLVHRTANDDIEEESPNDIKKTCKSTSKTFSDFARILLAEIILYPLLVCDLFELITDDKYKGESVEDRVSFSLFILSSISLILYVYITRILILIGIIYNVHKQRKPIIKEAEVCKQHKYDKTIARGALYFQGFFFIHTLGQMIAQVMMIVAIGAKIEHANKETNLDCKPWQAVCASPTLWYMLAAGWIMPICGFLTFFIVTYYWVQQFPIGLCIDFVRIMEMPGVDDLLYAEKHFKKGAKIPEKTEMLAARLVANFVRVDKLENQFNDMRNIGAFKKFFSPFKSPMLVLLCLVYALLQLGFIICAALADTGPSEVLNGGGWILFYIAAIITGIIANLYTFFVAALWGTVIIGVIILIAALIACLMNFFLWCVLCLVLAGCSSDNNSNS